MKSKFITSIFVLATLLIACFSFQLEAKSRTRVSVGVGTQSRSIAPVYAVPRVQPVYVYPAQPAQYPVVYTTPVYQAAPVVYETPVYVYPEKRSFFDFSFNFGNFWW